MKDKYIIVLFLGIFIYSCSDIPNKSIFEPLTSEELSKIIKKDTLFIEFYKGQQKRNEVLNEIDKARFNYLTYRDLYKMFKYMVDTAIMNPLGKEWETEWKKEFGVYRIKVDSVMAYWNKYKSDNSPDRFVTVEFFEIDESYYSYSYDVKNVNLSFKFFPLQGEVEQIKFNYSYSANIDNFYGEKHNCILTAPFSSPIVRYWEVDYSDEKRLKNLSTFEFKRDYNIKIEITDVRKNGINYSIYDLNIPKAVIEVMETDSMRYPYLYEFYKENIVKEIVCPSYKTKEEYIQEKFKQLIKSKFAAEYAYIDYLSER